MIHKEAWYKETTSEQEYARLYRKYQDNPEDTALRDALLTAMRRLGKTPIPEEMLEDMSWEEIKSLIDLRDLPPVTFNLGFAIEGNHDGDYAGTYVEGYLDSRKHLERSPENITLIIPEFFNMLRSRDWEDGITPGATLHAHPGSWERFVGLEWEDHREDEMEDLRKYSKDLSSLLNTTNYYSETEGEYEPSGWKVVVWIQPTSSYTEKVLDWAREENLI